MSLAQREKYWSELNSDEKIERMREVVKTYGGLHDRIARLEHDLSVHEHKNGKVVLPLEDNTLFAQRENATFIGGRCKECMKNVRF